LKTESLFIASEKLVKSFCLEQELACSQARCIRRLMGRCIVSIMHLSAHTSLPKFQRIVQLRIMKLWESVFIDFKCILSSFSVSFTIFDHIFAQEALNYCRLQLNQSAPVLLYLHRLGQICSQFTFKF